MPSRSVAGPAVSTRSAKRGYRALAGLSPRPRLAVNDSAGTADSAEPIAPIFGTVAAGPTGSGRPANAAGADKWCRPAVATVAAVGTVNGDAGIKAATADTAGAAGATVAGQPATEATVTAATALLAVFAPAASTAGPADAAGADRVRGTA